MTTLAARRPALRFPKLPAPSERQMIRTKRALHSARIHISADQYIKQGYLVAAATALVGFVGVGIIGVLLDLPGVLTGLFAAGTAMASFLLVQLVFQAVPAFQAASRARKIEVEFANVVILCYALARGGLNTVDVFRAIRDEHETYGEISKEFGFVVRAIEWQGKDINSALDEAAELTPNGNVRAFFAGLTAILNSGADPRDYFRRQSENLLSTAEVRVEKEIDQGGLLAEAYVSGLLVLPLLLIIVVAVLSVFGGSREGIITLLVFGFIPLGTAGYVVLVDTLLPAEPLRTARRQAPPVTDFGVDVAATDVTGLPAPQLREQDPVELAHATPFNAWWSEKRRVLRAQWIRFVARSLLKPIDVFHISGVAGLLIFGAGATWLYTSGLQGYELMRHGTTLLLVTAVVAITPVAVFHEIRAHRVRKLEGALPEVLGKLSGFNDRGISILKAFQIVGQSATGPLASELRALERDVSWNHHLREAISRMRTRIATPRIARLGILLERAAAATSNLKEVLDVAAQDATQTEAMRARKRQGMLTYVVVIYVVFAVFLYTTYMIADLFYGQAGFATVALSAGSAPGLAQGMDPYGARILFLHAVLVQGAACGLVAGRLGEGYLLSGLKHSVILCMTAFIVFTFGGIM